MNVSKFNLENLFNVLISRTSSCVGEEFIEAFVREIANFFDAEYVLLGRTYDNLSIKTLFFYDHGEFKENFIYKLENTPCERVISGELCLYPEKVAELYPHDKGLVDLGVEAYLGTPFYLQHNCEVNEGCECYDEVYGILVIMRKNPIEDMKQNEALVKTFFQAYANRIATELERIKYENKLKNLANYDLLTNIHNKTYFVNFVKKFLKDFNTSKRKGQSEKKHALMFLDLDNFKEVNDTLGHDAGDKCLIKIARVIKSIIRDDDLISRFGGDEFVLLVKNINEMKDAQIVAEKILTEIVKFCNEFSNGINVTASIGISIFPDDSTKVEDLMIYADEAMYDSKRSGKNKFSFYSSIVP